VRYTDRTTLQPMLTAAAGLGIYDLIKVDYLVADMGPIRERLFDEASKVLNRKVADYGKLLGVAVRPKAIAEERYATFHPGDQYKTYTAYESGDVSSSSATRVVDKRKTSTSYYDPLRSTAFDAVVNPAGVEPTVQVTLFVKLRCEWAQK
jgi:hypothetical protein